jgi:hypothetical protein
MFTSNNRRPKQPAEKPVTKAIAQQKKTEKRLRKFDQAIIVVYGFLVLVVLARSLGGNFSFSWPVAQVGDRLVYSAASLAVTAPTTSVPAALVSGPWSRPGRSCVLDMSTMAKPGGAAMVTAIRPDGVMMLWAGGPTASGAANCSTNSPILVSNENYTRLVNAQMPQLPKNPR